MTGSPHTLLVPLDGSPRAERALPVAQSFARAFDAPIHVVSAAPDSDRAAARRAYLDGLEARLDTTVASAAVEVSPHPASVIRATAATLDEPLVCLATHARGRLATALLGSVADEVVAASPRPVLLVGPNADPGPDAAPIVVCVDGSALSEQAIEPALAWAASLGSELTVVTVAEPVLESVSATGPPFRRLFGPDTDAGAYVAEVTARFARPGISIEGSPFYDPISPADGVASYLRDHPARLVVATVHATAGSTQAFIGSTSAALVRHCPVPVLLQPVREGVART